MYPTYYNTFVNPMQPRQFVPTSGGQTVSGSLDGSGPTFNPYEQGGFTGYQPQQQQYGDQGSGKFGYGSQQNPYSAQRNQQNQQQLDNASLQVLNQGLTGQAAIDAINKQMGYDTGAVWDTVRGNIDVGTGGSSGRQYDRSGGGGYGAHGYDDAGMPAQSGGMMGSGPSMGQQQDPNAWRRQWMMRGMQHPMYNQGNMYGNIYPGYGMNNGFYQGVGLQGTSPTYGAMINQPMANGMQGANTVANSNGNVNQAYNRLNY